jgi:hypothetical protein
MREAFLRGISTRQVGRVLSTITGKTVRAQTVSKLRRDLDEAVRQFHQARWKRRVARVFAAAELRSALWILLFDEWISCLMKRSRMLNRPHDAETFLKAPHSADADKVVMLASLPGCGQRKIGFTRPEIAPLATQTQPSPESNVKPDAALNYPGRL